MTNPQDHQPTPPQDGSAAMPAPPAAPVRGTFGEISPGVPRYGQYAPPGYQPPSAAPGPAGSPTANPVPAPGVHAPGAQTGWPAPAAGAAVQAPRQVLLAVRFIRFAGIISAIAAVLAVFAMFNPVVLAETERQLRDMGFTDTSMLQPALLVSVVLTALSVLVYFWLASAIGKGHNWARITATILAGVSLLSLLVPSAVTVVQVLLGAIAVLMLWRAPAKDYFKR
ncbi:hypothetical protein ACQCSX_11835 [Pseudarthrobacter sp. P1]|uniref:hypothetical protein n=1 Tax=Pseudarthrobacter sp. P1 TaxID=3418418 RepID=UPI003CFB85C8